MQEDGLTGVAAERRQWEWQKVLQLETAEEHQSM